MGNFINHILCFESLIINVIIIIFVIYFVFSNYVLLNKDVGVAIKSRL